jgi:hypothetical protein
LDAEPAPSHQHYVVPSTKETKDAYGNDATYQHHDATPNTSSTEPTEHTPTSTTLNSSAENTTPEPTKVDTPDLPNPDQTGTPASPHPIARNIAFEMASVATEQQQPALPDPSGYEGRRPLALSLLGEMSRNETEGDLQDGDPKTESYEETSRSCSPILRLLGAGDYWVPPMAAV